MLSYPKRAIAWLAPLAACMALLATDAFAQNKIGKKPLILQPGVADKLQVKPNPKFQVTPGTKSYQNVKPPGVASGIRMPPQLLKKLSDPKWLKQVRIYSPDWKRQTIPLTKREREAMRLRPPMVPCPEQTPEQQAEIERHWHSVEQANYRRCLESYTRGGGDIPTMEQNDHCRTGARGMTARERRTTERRGGDGDADGAITWCMGGDDCDDYRPNRYPGNTEISDPNHVDEDCDPSTFGNEDRDRDGFISARSCNLQGDGRLLCGTDCDDNNQNIHPNQADPVNGIDENCDDVWE